MNKTKLFSRFGMEITDVDLMSLRDDGLNELLSDLEEHSLLVFRRQALDDDDLYTFSTRIGRLEESARRISHSSIHKTVSYLTNLRDASGNPVGFGGMETDYWHSDQEFRKDPATLASLYCLVPSTIGGTTSFASTAMENLALPAGLVEEISKLWAAYLPAPTHDNVEKIEVSHPVVLQSPRSGKRTVYVSENTRRFIGLDPESSASLKQRLMSAILDPANTYSHRWRMGDLVLYDNTQLLHRRDRFEGPRWLKATKIFAPRGKFSVPEGKVCT